jgi:hypothetical protein
MDILVQGERRLDYYFGAIHEETKTNALGCLFTQFGLGGIAQGRNRARVGRDDTNAYVLARP